MKKMLNEVSQILQLLTKKLRTFFSTSKNVPIIFGLGHKIPGSGSAFKPMQIPALLILLIHITCFLRQNPEKKKKYVGAVLRYGSVGYVCFGASWIRILNLFARIRILPTTI
jgi:hypothetical protein